MASIVERLKILVDGSQAKAEAGKVEASLTKSFLKANIATGILSKGMSALSAQVTKSFQAAQEYEKTNIRLNTALKNQGLEVQRNSAVLNKQAAQLERVAGISDENIRSIQALALNMGISVAKTDAFTKAAIRLSNTTGMSLDGAMKQLVKTTSGLSGELGEAIPQIRNLTKEQLKSGDAVKLINELWEGNLDLLNQGFSGKVNALGNAWDSFGEAAARAATESKLLNEIVSATTLVLTDLENKVLSEGFGSAALRLAEFFIPFRDVGAGEAKLSKAAQAGAGSFKPDMRSITGKPALKVPGKDKGGKGGKGGRGGSGRGKKSLRELQAPGDGEIITIGGFPVDSRTGMIVPPLPPDPAALQAAEEAEADIAARRQARREAADEKRRQWDEEQANAKLSLEKRITAEIDAEEEKRNAMLASNLQFAGGIFQSFASQTVDALFAMAEGQEVAWEKVILGMFRGLGTQMLAKGIADSVEGTARLIRSYGADQSGTALLVQGGVEAGIGGALIAGTLIGTSAIGQGGSGAGSSPSIGGGAAGVGGAGSYGGEGFAGAAGTSGNAMDAVSGGSQNVTINVIGELSPNDASIIQRGLDGAAQRGIE